MEVKKYLMEEYNLNEQKIFDVGLHECICEDDVHHEKRKNDKIL